MKSISSLIIAFISLLSVPQVKAETHTDSSFYQPATLGNFSATVNNNMAVLTWTTQQEINSSKFIIEKSSNGINWQAMDTVAASGNSNSPVVYYYADTKLFASTFYRLKQVSTDAVYDYSTTINVSADDFIVKIFPATVTNTATITITTGTSKPVTVKIYRNNGVQVKELETQLTVGTNNIEIPLSTLTAGRYTAVVYDIANGKIAATNFIKQ